MVEQAVLSDALLKGTKEVFETMVFMNLEESSQFDPSIDGRALLGSIAFKGNMEGSLGICCGAACAQAIAVNMLGIDAAEKINEEETCDAVCEVTNMVMGCFKSKLADAVGDLEVSIPSVVHGRELKNNLGKGASKILVKVNIADEYAGELSLLYRNST
ncbi:MAG: chemotaxis protein CheX [Planctomycetota bacterium]|jgi:CheY-specific phosphatase CheX